MTRALLVLVALSGYGCVQPAAPDPVFSVRIVTTYDASGVSSAKCPTGSRIVGGGCACKGVGDPLFAGSPAGNAYVCGCYRFGTTSEKGVEAHATCLSSSVSSSLSQSLLNEEPPDPETERVISELRRQHGAR